MDLVCLLRGCYRLFLQRTTAAILVVIAGASIFEGEGFRRFLAVSPSGITAKTAATLLAPPLAVALN
jgi:hypothetical protein